jgi:hypothetical protein
MNKSEKRYATIAGVAIIVKVVGFHYNKCGEESLDK